MPSSTAIVLNSRAMPPAAWIAAETMRPTGARCVCPGTNSVKLFATAMIGLPMSSAATPVARSSARAPAMLRPWVTVRDRRADTMTPSGSERRVGARRELLSDDPAHPAIAVARAAVLDVGELLAHVHRDLARRPVGHGEVELRAGQAADRRHHGGRAACEHLADRLVLQTRQHLAEWDVTLGHLAARVAQQLDDRRTRHADQDRAGQPRGGDRAIRVHHEDVHATELFEIGVRLRVQEADLLAAVLVGLLLRQQARGVVAT